MGEMMPEKPVAGGREDMEVDEQPGRTEKERQGKVAKKKETMAGSSKVKPVGVMSGGSKQKKGKAVGGKGKGKGKVTVKGKEKEKEKVEDEEYEEEEESEDEDKGDEDKGDEDRQVTKSKKPTRRPPSPSGTYYSPPCTACAGKGIACEKDKAGGSCISCKGQKAYGTYTGA
jgi:hypothetical protein